MDFEGQRYRTTLFNDCKQKETIVGINPDNEEKIDNANTHMEKATRKDGEYNYVFNGISFTVTKKAQNLFVTSSTNNKASKKFSSGKMKPKRAKVGDKVDANGDNKMIKKDPEDVFLASMINDDNDFYGDIAKDFRNQKKEKVHKCHLCDVRTASLHSMNVHILSHTSDRPFKCPNCIYAATTKGNLKTHFRIHTGERPYKCTLCEYATKEPTGLKRHMRTHTGEKPFHCTLCNYISRQSHILKRHMQKVHPNETIQTPIAPIKITLPTEKVRSPGETHLPGKVQPSDKKSLSTMTPPSNNIISPEKLPSLQKDPNAI